MSQMVFICKIFAPKTNNKIDYKIEPNISLMDHCFLHGMSNKSICSS